MAGNSIGKLFRVTTFGESHGLGLGCVVDGCPPGMKLSERELQRDLNRRRPNSSTFTTKRNELDLVKILSGVFNGITTGTPISLFVKNYDHHSDDYYENKNIFRPGHADYVYQKKYGIYDYRGGGRASARETVMRVAAGGIAKKYLKEKLGIIIRGYLSQIGHICCELKDWDLVENNPFFCPDPEKLNDLEVLFNSLKSTGNSIGAQVTVIAKNVLIGLGEPVFDRLDADIAHAMMSINAVKGVEFGKGFGVISLRGSESRDELTKDGFHGNISGGIFGGISSGQPIVVNLAFKPTSSVRFPIKTIDKHGNEFILKQSICGNRHDPCVGIRAVPIAEAMMAIVLLDHFLRYRAQCGNISNDSI